MLSAKSLQKSAFYQFFPKKMPGVPGLFFNWLSNGRHTWGWSYDDDAHWFAIKVVTRGIPILSICHSGDILDSQTIAGSFQKT